MDIVVRQKLRAMIARYGPPLCNDVSRCRGLLYDASPNAELEVHVLVKALEHRVPQDLLSQSGGLPLKAIAGQLADRLTAKVAMTPVAAQWAVESWMLALGLVTEADLESAVTAPPDAGTNRPTGQVIKPQVRSLRMAAPVFAVLFILIAAVSFGAWYVKQKSSPELGSNPAPPIAQGGTHKKPDNPGDPKTPVQAPTPSDSTTLSQRVSGYLALDNQSVDSPESQKYKVLAKQIYNSLMAEIEPDLVFERIAKLDEKYVGESAEQHAARLQRYEAAFEKLETELGKVKARAHRENLAKLKQFLTVEEWSQLTPTTVVDGLQLGKWVEEVRLEKKRSGLKEHLWLVADLEKIPGWRW